MSFELSEEEEEELALAVEAIINRKAAEGSEFSCGTMEEIKMNPLRERLYRTAILAALSAGMLLGFISGMLFRVVS